MPDPQDINEVWAEDKVLYTFLCLFLIQLQVYGGIKMGKIVLASSSPRRATILKKLKLDFAIIPSDYVEKHDETVFSYEFIEDLAYNKALDVAKKYRSEDFFVIGADTTVVFNNEMLGKPKNYNDAKTMLENLSGNKHFVVTSHCVINSKTLEYKIKSVTTYVEFEKLTDEQIDNYINNYKPFDKAGAYGIQELPQGFVKKVEGELDNVIGLSSTAIEELLFKISK